MNIMIRAQPPAASGLTPMHHKAVYGMDKRAHLGGALSSLHGARPAPQRTVPLHQAGGWQTSTHCPPVISASRAGDKRTALVVLPAAGSTSSYCCRATSR